MTTSNPTWLGTPWHARWLEQETDAILRFARASRGPRGFGYLGADGQIEPGHPVELWITCRMTHVFALGALLGRPGCAPLVDHGLRSITDSFEDQEHGGWFASVDDDGPVTDRKEAYPHAFVLLATASATAAGRPGASEVFARAQQAFLEHFWVEGEGMSIEGFDRAFAQPEDYRGVNANMHTVEAFLATADVSGDDSWLERALRVLDRVVNNLAPQWSWRIPEHFDPQWRALPDYNRDEPAHPFRPFGATIGHWFEWARLSVQAAAALRLRGREPDSWLTDHAVALFDAATREGWAVDGADGFVYTVDYDGRPVVHARMHWVVTEAIAAAAALHRATGEPRYDDWYRRWWDYAQIHLIERPGAWVHELDRANSPASQTWSGKPDAYHAIQATLAPRLPASPAFAPALAQGLLDT